MKKSIEILLKAKIVIYAISKLFMVFILVLSIQGCAGEAKYNPPETLAQSNKLVVYAPGFINVSVNVNNIPNGSPTKPLNSAVDMAIGAFKRLYPDVEVECEVIPYYNGDFSKRLQTEMMGGGGPDVILINPGTFQDIYKTMDTGVFLDLSKIMENDEEYNVEDYFQGAIGGGVYKGKQYMVPISFSPPLYIGSTAELERVGFNLGNVTDAVSLLEEARRCLPKGLENPQFKRVFGLPIGVEFGRLMYSSGIRLIDYENKKVLPDEEEFRRLLTAATALAVDSGDSMAREWPSWQKMDLLGGEVWFEDWSVMQLVFVTSTELRPNGGFKTIIPQKPDGGVHATFNEAAAIRAGSPNQQNAYNFIKVLLSDVLQKSGKIERTPVHKSSLTIQLQDPLKGDFYAGKYYGTDAQLFFDVADAVTDSEMDLFSREEYIGMTKWNTTPGDILWEKIAPAFINGADLDECIREAKEALEFYLSE